MSNKQVQVNKDGFHVIEDTSYTQLKDTATNGKSQLDRIEAMLKLLLIEKGINL